MTVITKKDECFTIEKKGITYLFYLNMDITTKKTKLHITANNSFHLYIDNDNQYGLYPWIIYEFFKYNNNIKYNESRTDGYIFSVCQTDFEPFIINYPNKIIDNIKLEMIYKSNGEMHIDNLLLTKERILSTEIKEHQIKNTEAISCYYYAFFWQEGRDYNCIKVKEYLYMIKLNKLIEDGEEIYKIGRTKDINKRMKDYKKYNPEAILKIEVENCAEGEKVIMSELAKNGVPKVKKHGDEFYKGNKEKIRTILLNYALRDTDEHNEYV